MTPYVNRDLLRPNFSMDVSMADNVIAYSQLDAFAAAFNPASPFTTAAGWTKFVGQGQHLAAMHAAPTTVLAVMPTGAQLAHGVHGPPRGWVLGSGISIASVREALNVNGSAPLSLERGVVMTDGRTVVLTGWLHLPATRFLLALHANGTAWTPSLRLMRQNSGMGAWIATNGSRVAVSDSVNRSVTVWLHVQAGTCRAVVPWTC